MQTSQQAEEALGGWSDAGMELCDSFVPSTLDEMYSVYHARIDAGILKINRKLPLSRRADVLQDVWTGLFEQNIIERFQLSVQVPGNEGKTFWSYLQRAAFNISWLLKRSRTRHEMDPKALDARCYETNPDRAWESWTADEEAETRMETLASLAMVRRVVAKVLKKPGHAERFYELLAEGYQIKGAVMALDLPQARKATIYAALRGALDEAKTELLAVLLMPGPSRWKPRPASFSPRRRLLAASTPPCP